MASNDNKKRATVCVLALACVALMVVTSMACVVNNDNGTSIDSRTDLIIGKENPPGQDPVADKEDATTDDNGKKFWNGFIKFQVKTDTTCKVINYSSKDRNPVVPDIACMDGHKYIVDEIGEDAFLRAIGKALISIEIGPYVKTISEKGVCYQGGTDYMLKFTIRDLEHSQLTYIGKCAFMNAKITFIELPASLTLIDDEAFRNCVYLNHVVLHSKSLQIKSEVFYYCYNLNCINLENVSRIGSSAFLDCEKLEDVNLSSAWDIREKAFKNCNLKHIIFAKNIAILEDKAFPGMCFSDFNNNILPKTPSGLAGKEFRKDIDNWYHQIR